MSQNDQSMVFRTAILYSDRLGRFPKASFVIQSICVMMHGLQRHLARSSPEFADFLGTGRVRQHLLAPQIIIIRSAKSGSDGLYSMPPLLKSIIKPSK